MERDKNRDKLALALFTQAFELEEAGDINSAVNIYIKSASLHMAPACINLGNIFLDNTDLKDRNLAVFWYKKGVKYGDPDAASNLAILYKKENNKRWYEYWHNKKDLMNRKNKNSEVDVDY